MIEFHAVVTPLFLEPVFDHQLAFEQKQSGVSWKKFTSASAVRNGDARPKLGGLVSKVSV